MTNKKTPSLLKGTPKTLLGLLIVVGLYVAQQSGVIEPLNSSDSTLSARPEQTFSDAELAQGAVEHLTQCRVLKVFDGDTFSCDLNGNGRMDSPKEKIRLLGIDAPETRYSAKLKRKTGNQKPKDEPFAMEAREFVQRRVGKQRVSLLFDVDSQDKYGRTLAFVVLNPKAKLTAENTLNGQLIQSGLSKTLFIGRNRRFEQDFNRLAKKARREQLGLWKKE